MQFCDLEAIRRVGVEEAVRRGLDRILDQRPDGIWIHLDVDVLGDDIMPAVDSPQPDGFSFLDMVTAIRTAMATGAAIGLQVTIFDPDPSGEIARELSREFVRAIRHAP